MAFNVNTVQLKLSTSLLWNAQLMNFEHDLAVVCFVAAHL